ncbi:MAG: SLBB domain-containing protein, partial [Acidimicrobiales bacterium]
MSRLDGTVDDVDPLAQLRAPEPDQQPGRLRQLLTDWSDWRRLLSLLALGVLAVGAAVWLLRPAAPPVEASLPMAAATAPAPGSPAVASATTSPIGVVIHVAGAVARPGVYQLTTEQRVNDAVDAAGGATSEADLARINLAALLQDGARVYVP